MHGTLALLYTYSSGDLESVDSQRGVAQSKKVLDKERLELVHCTYLGSQKPQQMEETQMASPLLRHHSEKVGISYTPTALQSQM